MQRFQFVIQTIFIYSRLDFLALLCHHPTDREWRQLSIPAIDHVGNHENSLQGNLLNGTFSAELSVIIFKKQAEFQGLVRYSSFDHRIEV